MTKNYILAKSDVICSIKNIVKKLWGRDMIHIVICDSEENEALILKREISNILNDKAQIQTFSNPFALVTHIMDEAKGQVDIVFIDICLRNQDGIYLAETIIKEYPHIKIIFTTSQIEKVKDIFRINPVYFLTKPMERKYLSDALDKVIKMVDETNSDVIRIGSGVGKNRVLSLKMSEVFYIKSDKRQIVFHLSDTQCRCYMKLSELETELHGNFIRVHQSYIVNMDKIKFVSNGNVLLQNGMIIPISRSKLKPVMEQIKKYMEIG